jgi:hypothetical protein
MSIPNTFPDYFPDETECVATVSYLYACKADSSTSYVGRKQRFLDIRKRYLVFEMHPNYVCLKVKDIDLNDRSTTLYHKTWSHKDLEKVHPYPIPGYLLYIFQQAHDQIGRMAIWETFWTLEVIPTFDSSNGSWLTQYLPNTYKLMARSIQNSRDRKVQEVMEL